MITTPKQAYRTLISVRYREQLCQELPYLKGQLYRYVRDNGGEAYLAGYELQARNGNLLIRELETPDWEQLRLDLEESR